MKKFYVSKCVVEKHLLQLFKQEQFLKANVPEVTYPVLMYDAMADKEINVAEVTDKAMNDNSECNALDRRNCCPCCNADGLNLAHTTVCIDRPQLQKNNNPLDECRDVYPKIVVFMDVPCLTCETCLVDYLPETAVYRMHCEICDANLQKVDYSIRKWVFPEK